jgi:uncharacterized phage-associated protein
MRKMNISLPKVKTIILYFANHTETKFLGKVKLMKLFYFLDFNHVKNYGSPVTYDTYYKLEHGPIPTVIKNIVDSASEDIISSDLKDIIKFETPSGTKMQRILPIRDVTDKDISLLTATELQILNDVCKTFASKRTQEIEDYSHSQAPWTKTSYLQEIPYTLAAEDKDCKVEKGEIELLLSL